MKSELQFRPASDQDADDLIRIIGACYALYEGCILDLEQEEPELKKPSSAFAAQRKRLWILEKGKQMIGSVGLALPVEGERDFLEIVKLYLDPSFHGQGLGKKLCAYAMERACNLARPNQDQRIILWTDSRFQAAHRLYEFFGFVRQPDVRELHDLSNTTEYLYSRALD